MNFKPNLQTLAKLLNAVFTNPQARFQFLFPVYRVSGPNSRQYVLPDIGLRSTQGHSMRDDAGPGYLMAAQERLNMDQVDLPRFCVHGTDPAAWRSIEESHSLIPGGLVGNRAVVHFAVSLVGDHGLIVSGFRTNSSIYIFFDLR